MPGGPRRHRSRTIGSQLEILRARVAAEGQELCTEFCDDGYSCARLDRPGLDALREAADAGLVGAVWCKREPSDNARGAPDARPRTNWSATAVVARRCRQGRPCGYRSRPSLAVPEEEPLPGRSDRPYGGAARRRHRSRMAIR